MFINVLSMFSTQPHHSMGLYQSMSARRHALSSPALSSAKASAFPEQTVVGYQCVAWLRLFNAIKSSLWHNPSMVKRKDENETAFAGLQELIRRDAERDGLAPPKPEPTKEPTEKNPAKVAAGRQGGLKGGKARADSLTPTKRRRIAKKAARTRWGAK